MYFTVQLFFFCEVKGNSLTHKGIVHITKAGYIFRPDRNQTAVR